LLAICSEKGGEDRVFGELEEEEGKESSGRWRNYSADGRGDESVACTSAVFTLGFN
jgi:hypothetical protein